MPAPRRPRGVAVDPTQVSLRIQSATRDQLKAWAARGGISMSLLLDELVQRVEVTAEGMPAWLPAQNREGELPIYTDD